MKDIPAMSRNAELIIGMWPHDQITARQYAAIHLLQPSSGLDWLDDMIRARMRDEMAGMAMQGLVSKQDNWYSASILAYSYADAMIKQREDKNG